MIYATWNHMLKEFSLVDGGSFSICLPGGSIPSWFTYQNSGPSITVKLPPNWYNNEFMGFAVCVVSDLIRTPFLLELQRRELLQKIPGFPVQFTLIDKEMNLFCYVFTMAYVGAENNIDSEHTCLGYLPFDNILDTQMFRSLQMLFVSILVYKYAYHWGYCNQTIINFIKINSLLSSEVFGAQIAYGAQISIVTALVSLHFTFTPLTITITTVRVPTVEPPLKRLRIANILLVSS
ncbi:unnamed protein product [Coffea canephora]|uniref:DH200=94 genomic scaffold, scaffold_1342 n=1 Tax=Coffea canephora TaxID=49390 RepID=A0A068VIA0_COFCA|nr:unnamed protein product [Coffea canephora]